VPHAGQPLEPGTGDLAGEGLAVAEREQRVRGAVQDQARRGDLA